VHRDESRDLNEYDDVKDNVMMTKNGSKRVLAKAGNYIYSMGIVNFFEYLIINLLLLLHVDGHQRSLRAAGKSASFLEANVRILA